MSGWEQDWVFNPFTIKAIGKRGDNMHINYTRATMGVEQGKEERPETHSERRGEGRSILFANFALHAQIVDRVAVPVSQRRNKELIPEG